MKEYTLNGTKREAVGKKASKEMRKQGLVPCNIYGENNVDGKPEAFAFSIPASEIRKVVYTPHWKRLTASSAISLSIVS